MSDLDFVQAGDLFRKVMNDEARAHLIDNLVTHMCGAQKRLQVRQSVIFYQSDPEYAERVSC